METTSIRVRIENKRALEALRTYPRETIDDVLTRLIEERPKPSIILQHGTIGTQNGQREEQRP